VLAVLLVAACCAVAHAGPVHSLKERFDADSPFNEEFVAATPTSLIETEAEVDRVFCADEKGHRRACAHANGVCCPNKGYCCPEGHRCVLSKMGTNHCKKGGLASSESSAPASRTSKSRKHSSVSLPLSRSVESSFQSLGSGYKSLMSSLGLGSGSGSSGKSGKKHKSHHSGSRKSKRRGGRRHRKGSSGSSSSRKAKSINVVNHIILNTTPNPVVASGAAVPAPASSPKFKSVDPDTVSNSNSIPLSGSSQSPTSSSRSVSGSPRGVPKVK